METPSKLKLINIEKMGTVNYLQREGIPDIAGVRIPSPITMQVPTRTRIRIALFHDSRSSNHFLVFAANDLSWKVDRLYVVSSSSVRC